MKIIFEQRIYGLFEKFKNLESKNLSLRKMEIWKIKLKVVEEEHEKWKAEIKE